MSLKSSLGANSVPAQLRRYRVSPEYCRTPKWMLTYLLQGFRGAMLASSVKGIRHAWMRLVETYGESLGASANDLDLIQVLPAAPARLLHLAERDYRRRCRSAFPAYMRLLFPSGQPLPLGLRRCSSWSVNQAQRHALSCAECCGMTVVPLQQSVDAFIDANLHLMDELDELRTPDVGESILDHFNTSPYVSELDAALSSIHVWRTVPSGPTRRNGYATPLVHTTDVEAGILNLDEPLGSDPFLLFTRVPRLVGSTIADTRQKARRFLAVMMDEDLRVFTAIQRTRAAEHLRSIHATMTFTADSTGQPTRFGVV